MRINQLVSFILNFLEKVSQSKSRVVSAEEQGTMTLLTSLHYL